ncbi:MAG: hypothetical protein ACRBEQ_06930 [Hyphomonas sp.]
MQIAFWAATILLAFAILLAIQMRMITSMALKRAAAAHLNEPADSQTAYAAVLEAAAGGRESAGAAYLLDNQAGAIGHLRLARKSVAYLLPALLAVLIAGKFILEVF